MTTLAADAPTLTPNQRALVDAGWAAYHRSVVEYSCDGTFLTFAPETNLPIVLAWTRNNDQPALFSPDPPSRLDRNRDLDELVERAEIERRERTIERLTQDTLFGGVA